MASAATAASSLARWRSWLLCCALLLRIHASSCVSLTRQRASEAGLPDAEAALSRPQPASLLDKSDDLARKQGADGDGRYRPELPFYLSADLKPLSQLYPSVLEQPSKDEMDINEEHASMKALYQGDIVLPSNRGFVDDGTGVDAPGGARTRRRRASTSVQEQLWPNAVVPYAIHNSIQQDEERMFAVQAAIYNWERKTCLKFVPRHNEPDYVEFKHEEGCWSYIGRRGGRQVLSVGDRCAQIGIMIHELGHALGLWHEHSRPDRDAHIRIRWDHIAPSRLKNFAKSSAQRINSLGTPYDVSSIMHYGPRSFGMRDQTGRKMTTIELVDSGQERGNAMGQRISLSGVDVEQMNLLYRCAAKGDNGREATTSRPATSPAPCLNGGTRSEAGGCLCPGKFGGDSCDTARTPASCEDHRALFDESEDGFYNITVRSCARPLQVYCRSMNSSQAATFIVPARSSHSYSHFYGPRTAGGVVETGGHGGQGGHGGGCQGKLRRDEWKQKGVTLFFRLRLDTARMTLVQDDYSYSFSFGKRHPLGWAGDCYSRSARCRRGTLRVNLRGSGVRFAGLPPWRLRGDGVVGHSIRLHSPWVVAGSCGGWCGQCRLHDVRVTPEHC